MSMKIKTCPYCGHEPKLKHRIVLKWLLGGKFYRVKCDHCGLSTAHIEERDLAIHFWNSIKLELF